LQLTPHLPNVSRLNEIPFQDIGSVIETMLYAAVKEVPKTRADIPFSIMISTVYLFQKKYTIAAEYQRFLQNTL
jgi:hypothetical protein